MHDRREFLISAAKNALMAAATGLVWAGAMGGRNVAATTVLRPPGAKEEPEFIRRCTKCGLCAAACPFHAVIIAAPGDGRPVGTPYLVMRRNPCRMCIDIPCTAACPTGALDPEPLQDKGANSLSRWDVNKARIGVAVIDRETCIAYWGIQCDACYRACPLMDKAVSIEFARNDRTGKHSILGPVVHSSHCTGCGLCEHVCVTKKASIFVLPRQLAMGESSEQYVRGWQKEDEERLKQASEDTTTKTPMSERAPLDYLNQEGF